MPFAGSKLDTMSLQLDSITKQVAHETHLYEMSLALEPGLNVLLGPTTAGKTSLMRIMAGLDHPSAGTITEDGTEVTTLSVKKRDVAFVYQQFINYPSLTVFENIASPLRVRGGLNRAELTQRVTKAAEVMQIDGLLKRLPAELSGGQQQRTAIARALIKESKLLLMDEPLVNLDYKLREELRNEMQSIFASRDAIVVYSTTEPMEALMLGGKTFVLDQGQLLQTGSTLEVYHNPTTQRVGEVFSDPPMNMMNGHVSNDEVHLRGLFTGTRSSHMKGLTVGDYQIGARANHVTLTPTSDHDIAIPARIELAEISGSETFVHAGSREDDGEKVVAQVTGVHSYKVGEEITLYLNPRRLYVFEKSGALAAAPTINRTAPTETTGAN